MDNANIFLTIVMGFGLLGAIILLIRLIKTSMHIKTGSPAKILDYKKFEDTMSHGSELIIYIHKNANKRSKKVEDVFECSYKFESEYTEATCV